MQNRLLSVACVLVGLTVGAAIVGPVGRGAPADRDKSALPAVYAQMIARIEAGVPGAGGPVQLCFAPGTSDEVVSAVSDALMAGIDDRFFLTNRWGATALQPGGSPSGDPVILTYSFVPDGTFLPSFIGDADGVSNLFAG